MPDSTKRRCVSHGLALLLGLYAAAPVAASDGFVRVYATLFDEYAAALQPLSVQRTDWFHITVSTFFGPVDIPFYCTVTASISNVHFAIAASAAMVHGDITGTVCGIGYSSAINAPISISVDTSTSRLVVRPVAPTNINATVTVLGVPFTVPFTDVSLGPSLTESSIPLDVIQVKIESPSGPRSLGLVGRNQQVLLHNGYVGIQADAHFR
jgi:hypothetical protein